ncbi:MAG: ribonuclease D [Rhodospirillales bacterium]|nr:ribonuclease D [Rhodospirillales bacterium]
MSGLSIGGFHIHYHQGDLPESFDGEGVSAVAIDTETTGLNPHRDRLCLVQLTDGNGICHLVHFPPEYRQACAGGLYPAPRLQRLLSDSSIVKLFHFGRFDIGMLQIHLGVDCRPVYCTKIASKLVRTYTDRHGLKDLCRELLGAELSKEQQSSDWGAPTLSNEQLKYAAGDVVYLHRLREKLDLMLAREGRSELAAECFDFLPCRARLDAGGFGEVDIFAY